MNQEMKGNLSAYLWFCAITATFVLIYSFFDKSIVKSIPFVLYLLISVNGFFPFIKSAAVGVIALLVSGYFIW